jgi:hypothetical protein
MPEGTSCGDEVMGAAVNAQQPRPSLSRHPATSARRSPSPGSPCRPDPGRRSSSGPVAARRAGGSRLLGLGPVGVGRVPQRQVLQAARVVPLVLPQQLVIIG